MISSQKRDPLSKQGMVYYRYTEVLFLGNSRRTFYDKQFIVHITEAKNL